MTIAALAPLYLWTKSLHVIAVIAWMAVLLYLPRLFVYHCEVVAGTAESERFKLMERRLLRQIGHPAMVAALLFGIVLVLTPGAVSWSDGWWYTKLAGVCVLLGFHVACTRWRRDFATDRNQRPQRFFRIANEVPTVAMVVIVLMAIAQPF